MSIIYSWVFQLFIHYYLNHFQITSTVKVIISTIYLLLLVISTDISLSFLIILTVTITVGWLFPCFSNHLLAKYLNHLYITFILLFRLAC